MSGTETSKAYLWFDTEFTSLDLDRARLLQVALLGTDVNLDPLTPEDQGINLFIRLEEGTEVSSWLTDNLPDLITTCRSSQAVPEKEAGERMIEYVDGLFGPPAEEVRARPVLAGNSVHSDWFLARRFYPELCRRLHYRHLDVSALKLQWFDWLDGEPFDKENRDRVLEYLPFPGHHLPDRTHDAYYDIHASIAELNFYRKRLLTHRPDTP